MSNKTPDIFCLLPFASSLPLLGGVRGGFLLPFASCRNTCVYNPDTNALIAVTNPIDKCYS
ncbi:MAG: hypothetical protein F6K56_04330 [Moorea sp. SIO3G5]|nr:hypothetical protein [Moorena sp. SIO3G5]